MIESVALEGAPCFGAAGVVIPGMTKFNFFFGANGAGKSTIGKALSDPERFAGTQINWTHGRRPLTVRTYNLEYLSKTFGSAALPGVFLLGDDSVEIHARIAEAEVERASVEEQVGKLGRDRILKIQAIDAGRKALTDAAWNESKKVPPQLAPMFDGLRNNRGNFLARLLQFMETDSSRSPGAGLESLTADAEAVFDSSATLKHALSAVHLGALASASEDKVWRTAIVGSQDVEFAPLIEKLSCGDWVRAGVDLLASANGVCPFCQQHAPVDLEARLAEYFDEKYAEALRALDAAFAKFEQGAAGVESQISGLVPVLEDHFGSDRIQAAVSAVLEIIEANRRRLAEKVQSPSTRIELLEIEEPLSRLNAIVIEANAIIARHNNSIKNLVAERKILLGRAWGEFIRGPILQSVITFEAKVPPLSKAVEGLDLKIAEGTRRVGILEAELLDLHSQTTSSLPVIEAVNDLLRSAGFTSFSLRQSPDMEDGYVLQRSDGTWVSGTLSEGERTFIAFLYFYHQLRGVQRDSSESQGLIAVLDDPISSLDSDILFVVSTLIRRLMADVRDGSGRVQQIVLLTHNVHFHKEVTYVRKKDSSKEFSFFTVNKVPGGPSRVEAHGKSNPVRTAYRGLWDEVSRAISVGEDSNVGLQNVLRRILENYFRILGGVSDDSIIDKFTGEDQIVCRALFSWVNEGSHGIIEELHYSPSASGESRYLAVFEQIFEFAGHRGHYEMMLEGASIGGARGETDKKT